MKQKLSNYIFAPFSVFEIGKTQVKPWLNTLIKSQLEQNIVQFAQVSFYYFHVNLLRKYVGILRWKILTSRQRDMHRTKLRTYQCI